MTINPICQCEIIKRKIINLIESLTNYKIIQDPNSEFILHVPDTDIIIDNPFTTLFIKNKNKLIYNLLKDNNIKINYIEV